MRRRPTTTLRQALLHMDVHQGNVAASAGGCADAYRLGICQRWDVALEPAALFGGNALLTTDRERLPAEYVRLMPGLASDRLRQ